MVVNAKDTIAVGKLASSAFGRCFQHFCHCYSLG
jgi:hypothetical protein